MLNNLDTGFSNFTKIGSKWIKYKMQNDTTARKHRGNIIDGFVMSF